MTFCVVAVLGLLTKLVGTGGVFGILIVLHTQNLTSSQNDSEDWEKRAPTEGTQSRPDKNFSTTVQTLLQCMKLPVEQSTPV